MAGEVAFFELGVVDAVCDETVRRALKKTR